MTFVAMPSRANLLPAGFTAARVSDREFPLAGRAAQADVFAGAMQGAGSFQAPRRTSPAVAGRGGLGAAAMADAPWWGSEPMKVHLDLDRFDQGSDESTHLGEPGSVGSNSPRDDGASERSLGDAEGHPAETATVAGLPSRGAFFHATGQCKPCAWFWKPQGCANGRECNHCHLCAPGELKRRKLDKVTKMQAAQATQAPSGPGSATPPQPTASTGPGLEEVAPLPTSEFDSPWTVPLASGPRFSLPELLEALKLEEVAAAAAGSTQTPDLPAQAPAPCGPAKQAPGAPPGLDALPSRGAALHGTGECRPCAWFWKPQGCANGRDCRHCHACPFGELKNRKQRKVAALRDAGPGAAPEVAEAAPAASADSAEWQIAAQPQQRAPLAVAPPGLAAPAATRAAVAAAAAVAVAASPWPVALPGALASAGAAVPLLPAAAPAPAPHQPASPAGTEESLPLRALELSRGAAQHGFGACQPCAWFWKPQGCANGEECTRCHLCPEGEVRRRRKAKISAMKVKPLCGPTMLEEGIMLPQALLD